MDSLGQLLANELKVNAHQVRAAIQLMDSGATVPFIARYRKEATGGLTDTHLRLLAERLDYCRDLEKRRLEIIHSIEDQKKMTEALRAAIEKAQTKAELEDLYLPFRPRRHSKAQAARDCGLEPLALRLLENPALLPEEVAMEYISEEKNVSTVLQALSGAREILMEKFSESPALISLMRKKLWHSGWVYSKVADGHKDAEKKLLDYYDFRQEICKLPSHRALALFRGKKEGILNVWMGTDGLAGFTDRRDEDAEYLQLICAHFKIEHKRRPADAWIYDGVKMAWKYKIKMHLELDIFTELRKNAEEEAIRVFAENFKNLLLAAPAGARPTLGLDPGFRTGIKAAAVDSTGKLLETATIYPLEPEMRVREARETLNRLLAKHKIELIAIGNGTASRETDFFVQNFLKDHAELKIQTIIVSEAGASVYSASEEGAQEFPNLDVSLRGAVSIARRLQDPLAELVKIDPKSIGVGQYQHDVNQTRLQKMLGNVVEDCVNAVGVDLNMASAPLLSYVAGLNKKTAAKIVEFRDKHGAFNNRQKLLEVSEIGSRVFEQAAGFLRISNGENPLDASAVHPESYSVVQKIAERCGREVSQLIGNASLLAPLNAEDFIDEKFGVETVQDILEELEKPGRDPRPEFKTARFAESVRRLEDLKKGLILEGVITNVANFGAFVDIGVHQDGLIHVSQISREFVQDPRSVLKTGQIVRAKVLDVDVARKRISLSLKLDERIQTR